MSTTTKSDSQSVVVTERTIDAPVALVWRALTNLEDMRRWFFDLEEFKAEVGFKFKFDVTHKGTNFCHRCQITEVIPQKKLAYSWRYEGREGDSLVTIDLVPDGDKTKFKLTHTGLDTFPKTPEFASSNFNTGWNCITDSFKEIVDTIDREIYVERVVNAPRELVWEAFSNPEHVAKWWGPNGFSVTIRSRDFRVGGEWIQAMHGPDGANYENHHTFKEIVKPERIVMSHGGHRVGGPSVESVTATWTFEPVGENKTKVCIRMIFPSAENRNFVAREFKAVEGAQQTLGRLNDYLPKIPAAAIKP